VAPITIVAGILLIAVGVGGFALKDPENTGYTALIPAVLGVVLVLLGVLARKDHMRKHAMHLAAVLGLVGVLASLIRLGTSIAGKGVQVTLASVCLSLMALICAVFVGLCVNSFIAARKRRAAADETGST
jgi:hypothetical protein